MRESLSFHIPNNLDIRNTKEAILFRLVKTSAMLNMICNMKALVNEY